MADTWLEQVERRDLSDDERRKLYEPKTGDPEQNRHEVTVHTVQARCCDEHLAEVARCTCGWQSRDTLKRDAWKDAQGHRLDVLEAHLPVSFTVS